LSPTHAGQGLAVSLDGRLDAARTALRRLDEHADPHLVSLSTLIREASGARPERPPWLAASGGPPEEEIGYGLLSAASLALRPRRVVLVDSRSGRIRSRTLARHLAASAGRSLTQLLASSAALATQLALVAWLERTPPPLTRRSEALGRVMYLRAPGGYSSPVGGAITHTLEVVGALAREGIAVDCATTDRLLADAAAGEPGPAGPWHVVGHPSAFDAVPASYTIAGDIALARAGLEPARQADVVYQRHARFTLAGAILSRLSGAPLFLEYNSPGNFLAEDPPPFVAIRQRCERAMLDSAARILVVSEHGRDLLAASGVDRAKIVVNPNGVDLDRYGRADRAATRAELSLTDGEFAIGFVGSFHSFHGVPVLARAFHELAARRPHARLVLIGDGEERQAVERILGEELLDERVRMLGSVPRDRIPGLLEACDALASPHVELEGGVPFFGSPTKLFEYMAAGRPVVASALGQIADVLDHERSALLVPPGDAGALAGALERLIDYPDMSARLAVAARAEAEQHHSWRHNARRLAEAYAALPPEGDA
jgi:glycosyltransferase involved in cell wall biosynthesis